MGANIGDSVSNIIGIVGIRLGDRPADDKYPYGYSKFETVATIVVSAMLLVAAIEILEAAWRRAFAPVVPTIGLLPFAVVLITVVINLFVYWYERKRGKELASEFLKVDANHTLSDVFVSMTVLVGLVLLKIGYAFVDPLVSVVIVFFILKLFYSNVKEAAEILCDSTRIPKQDIERVASSIAGVRFCHAARSRGREDAVFMDLHVGVDPDITVERAHQEVSRHIEARLRERYPQLISVIIRIEPDRKELPCEHTT